MNDESIDTSDLYAVRLAKLQDLRARGADPFRANCEQSHSSLHAIAAMPPAVMVDGHDVSEGPLVKVAGRITTVRLMGKASFAKILDRDGIIQLYFKKEVIGDAAYDDFKKLDMGDIIGVEGPLFRTKTGEVTVRVLKYTLVSKALRPLPEKWHGLADADQIYRQRYLDLISNEDSRRVFRIRSKVISCIRRYLDTHEFIEVETPILQPEAGGAAARPFVTHFNALDCQFYLRIALELYLKRCLVGGIDRVYEIGRNFRNEGLSRRHNPEFTMLEVYQSYSDFRGMMKLIRGMIDAICTEVLGTSVIKRYDGVEINLGGEWREARYRDLVCECVGDAEWFSRSKEHKIEKATAMGLEVSPLWEDFEVTNDIFGKKIEPTLIQPTFVTHLPKELCPLAKLNQEDPSLIDVFELCINGQEIAPAYSEQNDPLVQRQMLEAQAGEEQQKIDEEFLLALEHGMPPAGGMGVGIDRLVIMLTGAASIRDVILFPSLKPVDRGNAAK
ncbi:MAG: lysine--tRNA ligase [Verrucomicrobiota bacterium]|nr:lysine--tRNA ligase [Verrucomicrobiota bacterium]